MDPSQARASTGEHTDMAAVLVVAVGPLTTPGAWGYINTITAGASQGRR
jgi:hypothetical protein